MDCKTGAVKILLLRAVHYIRRTNSECDHEVKIRTTANCLKIRTMSTQHASLNDKDMLNNKNVKLGSSLLGLLTVDGSTQFNADLKECRDEINFMLDISCLQDVLTSASSVVLESVPMGTVYRHEHLKSLVFVAL